MTGGRALISSPVAWLSAQAIVFGAMAAILGVVANTMFLEAYGSAWLPVTYIVIGVAGVLVSAAIRRGAERFDLLRMAVAVLGGASVLFALSWLLALRPEGVWVSAPLLVVFPILIQLGFVFIGGQAGRVLDISGIKTSFPRIMAGFPLGATVGGLAAVPLVDRLGRVEDLLLITAIVQGSFAALVWATGRRFAQQLTVARTPAPATAAAAGEAAAERVERSLRALLGRSFIVLLLAYQVLSALGSQVADFLVLDRAIALFPGEEDLGRFLAGYTAVMNAIAIAFLFLVAGPLLRRHGLRLGIGANPLTDLVLALAILVVLIVSGPTSVALLGIVSAARIADVALTDGMTRTSINALYQVLPSRQRLAAQATVEGMGVPLAIGASGVLILLLSELPVALEARIVVLALVCGAWSWVALRLYRGYAPALSAALRSRRLLDPAAPIAATVGDVAALASLATGDDPSAARLAREIAAELAVADGDADAVAMGSRAVALRDVAALEVLLGDPSPEVRAAALIAVQPGDEFALEPAMRALLVGSTAAPAAVAIGRLGDAAVPALGDMLDEAAADRGTAARRDALVRATRMVRAMRTAGHARDALLARHAATPDRALGLSIIERLGAPTEAVTASRQPLDEVVRDDLEHAERVLAALLALDGPTSIDAVRSADAHDVLAKALAEELDLLGRRVVAAMVARYGRDALGAALSRLAADAGEAALAVEALEVTVGRQQAAKVVALLAPGLNPAERLHRLRSADTQPAAARPDSPSEWLLDIAGDGDGVWRSAWLRACAIRAIRVIGPAELRADAATRASGADDPLVAEELVLLRAAADAA